MVVDAHYRIVILLNQCSHKVVGTLLHLRVGTLHGVELYAVAVTSCVYRRHRATTKTDTVVVTADNDNLVALLRFFLQAVALCAIANTTCKHDYLVVGIFLVVLLMFESEQRTCDEWLAKLVAEVAGTIRGLDKNLLRALIQPLPYGQYVLPVA